MTINIDIKISDLTGREYSFSNLALFKDFIKKEIDFWTKNQGIITEPLPSNIKFNELLNAFAEIYSWIENQEILKNDQLVQDGINSKLDEDVLISRGSRVIPIKQIINQAWIESTHSFIIHALELANTYGYEVSNAFILYIINKPFSLTNSDSIKGTILAYEFQQSDSKILKRRESENKSFELIRNELITSKEKIFQDIGNDVSNIKLQLGKLEGNIKENEDKQEKNYTEQCQKWENDLKIIGKKFSDQHETWEKKCTELETLYREKLRLEAPAKYWSDAADQHEKQSQKAANVVIWTVIITVCFFLFLLLAWMWSQPLPLNLNTLQGAVLLVILLSIFLFALKIATKAYFSSLHLMRDAEERLQLVHVYLALTAEKGDIDLEARKIVFQALFSRAETGLLGGDSGPTMPGIQEVVNKMTQVSK